MKRYGSLAGLLLLLSAVLLHPSAVEAAGGEERILEGVHIGSVDVGGMTKSEAEAAIEEYVDGMEDMAFTLSGPKGTISVTAEDMGLTADADSSVDEALGFGQAGSLIERFKAKKAVESGDGMLALTLSVDRQKTANIIYDSRDSLDIPAEDNRLTRENGEFSYIEGQRGEEVNIVASVYEIERFLSAEWDGTEDQIALVTEEIEPRGSEEELAKVRDVLGTFSTDFSSSNAGRVANVTNGCAKVNGHTLFPGEEFSVYQATSPFTQENGYELAGSYSNGTVVESFGGGICQVSTTLYNAVIRAELEITQRYNHSMIVTYVDPSADAAIAGTYKDFRFVNNLDTPIYIEGYCQGGTITFNIYGEETRPSNREISFESEVLEKLEPEIQFELTSGHDLGYFSTTQSSHTGYVSQLWKTVTVDGEQESREVFNRSTYRASPKIIAVGTRGATEEQLAAIKSAAGTKSESKVHDAVSAAKAANDKEEEEQETEEEEGSEKDSPDKKDDSGKKPSKKDDADKKDDSHKKDSSSQKGDSDKKDSSSKEDSSDKKDDSGQEDDGDDGSSDSDNSDSDDDAGGEE